MSEMKYIPPKRKAPYGTSPSSFSQVQPTKAATSSILNFFSGTPRPQQSAVLLEIEKNWEDVDVFVVQAPVSVGKSRMAMCIAAWAAREKGKPANVLTPQNVLVEQYRKDFPKVFCLEKKSKQRCRAYLDTTPHRMANCDYHHKLMGEHCPDCPYIKRVRQAHSTSYMLCNNYVYLAHKLYKPVAIFDEAHSLLRMLQDLSAKTLWHHDYQFPSTLETYGQLYDWLEQREDKETDKKLKAVWDCVSTGNMRYLMELGVQDYQGNPSPCIQLLPLSVANEKPVLWPDKGKKKVEKIILMSATLSRVDVEALGLAGRRIQYLTTTSPIPTDRRPVVVRPIVSMGRDGQEKGIPELFNLIKTIRDNTQGKGLVHVTYSIAERLRQLSSNERWLRFHDKTDKLSVYESWRNSNPQNSEVLIGCGLDEGIDLAGEEFGWQVIGKVRFPSLEEPTWKYCLEADPARYYWETLRSVAQATGRICRTPTDFGITFIVDKGFSTLYKASKQYKLMPEWLEECLIWDNAGDIDGE